MLLPKKIREHVSDLLSVIKISGDQGVNSGFFLKKRRKKQGYADRLINDKTPSSPLEGPIGSRLSDVT